MLIEMAIGAIAALSANKFLKENKNPKTKEEIKDDIRKGTDTISKYASAIYEVANEKINNIQHENKESEKEEIDYFKNIRKDGQE